MTFDVVECCAGYELMTIALISPGMPGVVALYVDECRYARACARHLCNAFELTPVTRRTRKLKNVVDVRHSLDFAYLW